MDRTVSVSPPSSLAEEVFASRERSVSIPSMSALYLRMPAIPVAGHHRGSSGPILQQNNGLRRTLRLMQSWRHGSRHQEVVYREVWPGKG